MVAEDTFEKDSVPEIVPETSWVYRIHDGYVTPRPVRCDGGPGKADPEDFDDRRTVGCRRKVTFVSFGLEVEG